MHLNRVVFLLLLEFIHTRGVRVSATIEKDITFTLETRDECKRGTIRTFSQRNITKSDKRGEHYQMAGPIDFPHKYHPIFYIPWNVFV